MEKEVEKKQAEQTAPSEATTEEQKDQSQLSEESKTQPGGINYAEKLEQERKRREKAEAKIVDLKKEKKEAKTEEEQDVLEARIAQLEQSLISIVEQKTQELEMRTQRSRYDEAIRAVSSSEDEQALIRDILEHDIKPTGDIERDVRRAKILANEDSIANENEELKRALTARSTAGSISTGGQRVIEEKQTWTAADRKFAQAAGLDLTKVGKRK